MSRWVIKDSGLVFDVRKDGTPMAGGLLDCRAALRIVRAGYQKGDTVTFEEPDAYQTRLTRYFERNNEMRWNPPRT